MSEPGHELRSRAARFVLDPLLVCGALIVLVLGQVVGKVSEDSPAYNYSDSPELSSLVSKALTLEESLAAEATTSSRELPIRVDEITVLRAIDADGNTLRMTFDVEQEIETFKPGFESGLAASVCQPEMFASDIARGGRIIYIYRGPSGRVIDQFEITREDCRS